MKILRDYFIWTLIACLFSGALFVLAVYVEGQEKEATKSSSGREHVYDSLEMTQAKEEVAKKEEPEKVKAWKLPIYMQENLQWMLNDFNKKFEEKVQAYKKELKTRFEEFKDMPDDVILYLEGGIFITSSDFKKLQDQLRDKLNKEVKGDDKTIN